MAVTWHSLFLILMLSGEGFCQCYSELSCGGTVIPSLDQRDCCILKIGLSYNDAGTCRPCIGVLVIVYFKQIKELVCFCSSWIPSESVQC